MHAADERADAAAADPVDLEAGVEQRLQRADVGVAAGAPTRTMPSALPTRRRTTRAIDPPSR
jgi:hypothetical protein